MHGSINMRADRFTILLLALLASPLHPEAAHARQKPTDGIPLPRVVFETNMGNITLELDSVNAPATVANFAKPRGASPTGGEGLLCEGKKLATQARILKERSAHD